MRNSSCTVMTDIILIMCICFKTKVTIRNVDTQVASIVGALNEKIGGLEGMRAKKILKTRFRRLSNGVTKVVAQDRFSSVQGFGEGVGWRRSKSRQ